MSGLDLFQKFLTYVAVLPDAFFKEPIKRVIVAQQKLENELENELSALRDANPTEEKKKTKTEKVEQASKQVDTILIELESLVSKREKEIAQYIDNQRHQANLEVHGNPPKSVATAVASMQQVLGAKRLANFEKITFLALKELQGKTTDDKPVDHGWAAKFFDHAKDISSEQLQDIWAKLLASKTQQTNSVSIHTLSVLSNLEGYDAQLFQDSTKFVFDNIISHQSDPDSKYSWKPSIETIEGFPSYGVITHLATLGLLAPLIGRRTYSAQVSDKFEVVSEWSVHGYEYELQVKNRTTEQLNINLPSYALSRSGLELCSVIGEEINPKYLKMVSRNIDFLLENKGEHRIMRRKLASNTSENPIDSKEEWEQISHKP